MESLAHYPFFVFVLTFIFLSIATIAGASLHKRYPTVTADHKDDLGIILAATLTLLALIIGFSFAMATNRYDERKRLEEAEASATRTEIARAELLQPVEAEKVRKLLREYLDQRILFYDIRDISRRAQIAQRTSQLEDDLWVPIREAAAAQPTPVVALIVAGMNDVFKAQGDAQAADWNRIPIAAWLLMAAIALCCTVLLGYRARTSMRLALVLPLVVAISFFLIADIDAPRHGLIHVGPENLKSVALGHTQ
ncbi:bestrophin-like domain [Bradyrhizobium sp. JR3.5]